MGNTYSICDIIEEYISGDWGNDMPSEDASCMVSCIRGADIVPIENSEFSAIPIRYISSKSLKTRSLQEGDIVIEKSGGSPTQSTGRVVYISKELIEDKGDIVCSNFCAAFRIKADWDSKYIYYYLKHIYNAGVFFNFEGKTSGLKNLIMDTAFKSITIEKIAIEQQNSIATILSTLDSKIASNRAINHYLEEMAKQLYDYWFVQFDFPDENGRPYKSSGGKMVWNEKLNREIPQGWSHGSLLDIANYTNGLACQKFRPTDERKLPVIKIKEMHDGFSSETEYVTADISKSVIVYDGDVLFSWSASLEVMLWACGNGGLNQHIFKVTSKNGYPKSLYYYQLLNYIAHFKRMAEARKTTMGHITQEHLQQSIIVLPPDLTIPNQLEVRISPILEQIILNNQEIIKLTRQRDELLPLLMNGQLSVTQLNNDL